MTAWVPVVFGVFGLTAPRNAVGIIPVSSESARGALRHLDTP